MVRFTLLSIALVSTFVPSVHAVYYYENTQYRYSANQSRPNYNYNYNYYPISGRNRVCLYSSSAGECMVEQYIDTSNYNASWYYAPTYNRDYLYYEREYADRDDDYYDYDDDDYYSTDDDDFYDDDDHDIDDDDWEDIKDDFFDDDDDSDDDDDD